jgi:hypothetical protein
MVQAASERDGQIEFGRIAVAGNRRKTHTMKIRNVVLTLITAVLLCFSARAEERAPVAISIELAVTRKGDDAGKPIVSSVPAVYDSGVMTLPLFLPGAIWTADVSLDLSVTPARVTITLSDLGSMRRGTGETPSGPTQIYLATIPFEDGKKFIVLDGSTFQIVGTVSKVKPAKDQ